MTQSLGVAEAKRLFSALLDRVGAGERIVIVRRGRPAVVLVPPSEEFPRRPDPAPTGFAAIAAALAELDELEDIVRDIYIDRRKAEDRPAPSFN
jgi:prevent-host-death family protein